MISVQEAIELSDREFEKLPRKVRKQVEEVKNRFNAFTMQAQMIECSTNCPAEFEITMYSPMPAGMVSLPNSAFLYRIKVGETTGFVEVGIIGEGVWDMANHCFLNPDKED